MADHDFIVEYEFSSTRADGDAYTRRRTIKAKSASAAITLARIVGFSEFGERFTDNCFDWRIVQ
jgi:hypothetical protein